MYKLLIVEDEKWEREGLLDFLNWPELNIEISGAAENGIIGLDMVQKDRPQIIITDIRMPLMDGIEFIKKVKQFSPDSRFIITSGYDDFGYAQEAITLGVSEYLLKPIQRSELLETLKKITDEIYQELRQKNYSKRLEKQLAENHLEEKELLLQKAVYRQSDELNSIGRIPFISDEYEKVIAVVRFGSNLSFNDREKQKKLREIFHNIAFKAYEDELIARSLNGCDIIIFIPDRGERKHRIDDIISQIIQNCQAKDIALPFFGIGSIPKTEPDISAAFCQALAALDYIFFSEERVLHYKDIKLQNEQDYDSLLKSASEYTEKVLLKIDSPNHDNEDLLTIEIFNYIRTCGMDRKIVNIFLTGLCGELSLKMTGELNAVVDSEIENIIERINDFSTLSEMEAWFRKFLLYTGKCISEKKYTKEMHIVKSAKARIAKDYHKSIGIEVIADRMGISPNYLGRIFKQYEGKYFTESLTEYRMEKAVQLLTTERVNVTETAQAVGFVNTAHFCTVFKKKHGISPAEYQKKTEEMHDQ